MDKILTFFTRNWAGLLLFSSILVVYGLSFYQRQSTFDYWIENSQDYVVEDVIAMSSMDSYYWLKMAKELDRGTLGKGQADPTKGYPDMVPLAIQDTPSLLAELISFGKKFTGGNYYQSGLLLIPILAGLFIFPLFFYFNKIGFGASAVMGGLIGTFSHAYYDRTMMGRVDTDLLNTFFPIAAACFILAMDADKSWRRNLCLCIGAGLTMNLFTRWYQQPSFIMVFLLVLGLHLLLARVHWKQILILLPVYLLASGPEYSLQIGKSLQTFINAYIAPPGTGQIAWPDILQTVAEAQKRDLGTKLKMLHGFLPLVFAGFLGLLYLCLRRFKKMIPMAPLLLLGGWALLGPARFVMYLAPLVGIGVGVLIELIMNYTTKKTRLTKPAGMIASVTLMFILFFSTAAYTGFPFQVGASISAPTTRALIDIKRIVPKHSAMFTPYWEYGYALMDIGEFSTYHDGSLQGGIRGTLTAKAMTSTNQKEMVSLLAYLEDYGFKPLSSLIRKKRYSADEMMKLVFDYQGEFKGENVYILYLEDMIWKLGSMTYFGGWDFNTRKSNLMDYFQLHCFASVNDLMTCHDGTVDLKNGFMNDGSIDIPLQAALFVNDGYVVDRRDYSNNDGYFLQVLMKKGEIYNILVADEPLFRSNFNQQYLLGYYDRRYFEEVYNNFPVARAFKVKENSRTEAGEPK